MNYLTNFNLLFFIKFFLLSLVVSIFYGCAHDLPFRALKLSQDNNAKIKIRTQNTNFLKNYVQGTVFINSVSYGSFTKTYQLFETDVVPGEVLITICPPLNAMCVIEKININIGEQKNFVYTWNTSGSTLTQDVYENNHTSTKTDRSAPLENNNEKKCQSLGFSLGTSSFQKCVDKLKKSN